MPMQGVYELDAMDRAGRLSKSIAPWFFILLLMIVVATALLMDASLTPEQRIATFQQSGVFP
jgi:hypothetical protein